MIYPTTPYPHPNYVFLIFIVELNLLGGKEHNQFINEVLNRGSSEANRLLAELIGGLELGLEFSDKQAIILVGGATTRYDFT